MGSSGKASSFTGDVAPGDGQARREEDTRALVRGYGRLVLGVQLGGERYRPVDVIADLEHVDNLHGNSSSPAERGPNHVRAHADRVEARP